jgi:hypothetical protein
LGDPWDGEGGISIFASALVGPVEKLTLAIYLLSAGVNPQVLSVAMLVKLTMEAIARY